MSTWGNPFGGLRAPRVVQDGLAAVGRAQSIGAKTERERAYISAVALLYTDADTQDQRARTLAYEQRDGKISTDSIRRISRRPCSMPLPLIRRRLPTDKTYANQLKAAAILEELFKVEPDHPGVTHYLIHSYDVPPLAPRGLPYARRYADLAPDAPHALHMPAHTFTRVGSWQESIDTNIRSHDAAMVRGDSGEGLHAMDYMTYAYLQTAQDGAAKTRRRRTGATHRQAAVRRRARCLAWREDSPPRRSRPVTRSNGGSGRKPRVCPCIQRAQPYMEAMTHFARALGAARSGHVDAVKAEIDRLTRPGRH